MLMKISQYKSVMFTVSICLGGILLAILVAYACNLAELEEKRDEAGKAFREAKQALKDHDDKIARYLIGVPTVTGTTATVYTTVNLWKLSAIWTTRAFPAGFAAGLVGSSIWYFVDRNDLQKDLNEKSTAYANARADYEACLNPPAKYQFTDYNGYTYEFSDKDAFNQFLRVRGESTI